MLTIGDLARHTRVSTRMLRHYDELGLVVPERVDPATGYRWYGVSQIGRVNSLVALKELGFTLDQCRAILDEQVSVEGLLDLLRRRESELAGEIEVATVRLAEVSRRLRAIERDLTMTNSTLAVKSLPALRLAQVSAEVNDTTELGAAVSTLLDTLTERAAAAGLIGVPVRTYYGRPDGSKIDVAVGLPATAAVAGLELVELPAVDQAASVVHRGPAEEIADAWQTLDVGLEERGLESYGMHRQIHHVNGVELQCPVRDLGSCAFAPGEQAAETS